MSNNLFNIDFVKAKTGKILSKTEKNIQYILNLLISWTVGVILYGIIVMIGFSIIKMLWHFLIT